MSFQFTIGCEVVLEAIISIPSFCDQKTEAQKLNNFPKVSKGVQSDNAFCILKKKKVTIEILDKWIFFFFLRDGDSVDSLKYYFPQRKPLFPFWYSTKLVVLSFLGFSAAFSKTIHTFKHVDHSLHPHNFLGSRDTLQVRYKKANKNYVATKISHSTF